MEVHPTQASAPQPPGFEDVVDLAFPGSGRLAKRENNSVP